MIGFGHNESAVRLGMLADEAARGLERIATGEADAIEGWLAYGAALNEGRALFPGDAEFGQWLDANSLRQLGGADIHDHERSAAMWAAAHRDQFEEVRSAGKARTVRGIHDKWKQIEAEREEELRAEKENEQAASIGEPSNHDHGAERLQVIVPVHENTNYAALEDAHIHADQEDKPSIAPTFRAGLSGLTREALEDDVAALRQELAKARTTIAGQKAEIADLKTKLTDATADDRGAVIRRLQKDVEYQRNRAWRETEERGRVMKQVYALNKRVKELENMEISMPNL